MSSPLRTAASLVLMAVLMGAPLAGVVCAEWCAPSGHEGHAQAHRSAPAHAPAAPAAAGAADCHGRTSGNGPRVAAHVTPECLDYALAWRDQGPVKPRLDLAQLVGVAPATVAPGLRRFVRSGEIAADLAHTSPPRPLAAGPVLRI